MRLSATILPALLMGLCSLPAQQVPTGFTIDTLVSSLPSPLDFCWLPDGRILICNQAGQITVYNGASSATIGTVPSIETGSEKGLLSICADPLFGTNGYIYVWYSSTADAFMHLDRFTVTGDLANPNSNNLTLSTATRRVILGNAADSAFNHNGGTCRFGPDGRLYLSIGDDASQCQAQNVTTMQGALLRMDVSTLPAGGSTTAPTATQLDPGDNPLSTATDFSQLVLCSGLRNPYRFNVDPTTGNLYIADVGQNSQEELDEYVYNSGALTLANYGWPWREGTSGYSSCTGSQPAVLGPMVGVPQGGSWLSIMGGPRYRNFGGQYGFGAAYENSVFYGDYYSGHIRRLVQVGGVWQTAAAVPGQPSATNWGQGFNNYTGLQNGLDGALYFVTHSGSGTLKRIRPLGPVNQVIAVSGGNQIVPAGEPFPSPVVVRLEDPNGNPIVGGPVSFTVTGPATLSTTNPVLTDGNGTAQTSVTATNFGGAITVNATTPGNPTPTPTSGLFSRKLTLAGTPTLVVLSITNSTTAVPATTPFILMASQPGIPPLMTPIGPICTDPANPATIVFEDSIGIFGNISYSGTGAIGTPSLTKIYNVPAGVLTGLRLSFQAVGFDGVRGMIRTNCETRQF